MLYYGNYTEAKGLVRIDKELSISNSINIGEVSGGDNTGGVVGWLENNVNSAGTKLYSHNTVYSIINCSNRGNIVGGNRSGGVVGAIGDNNSFVMSYAGITSKEIANTIVNQLIIKYCFNAGSITGVSRKGGVIGYIGGSITRGGRFDINVSYNHNVGRVSNTSAHTIGGVISEFPNINNSDNGYFKITASNNFNTGLVQQGGVGDIIGGAIAYFYMEGIGASSNNTNVSITNNYNYSTDIIDGRSTLRGGVVGEFRGDCSQVNLLNNYSAYKREDDNNVHGKNTADPTTNGANVGEVKKIINNLLKHYLQALKNMLSS